MPLALPDGTTYRSRLVTPSGEPVPIGAPINRSLDTAALHTY